MPTGILVHGSNHFIVRGPLPDWPTAAALVRNWSVIRIGSVTPPHLYQWGIITREFRENLEWAVVVPGEDDISPAVSQLLGEIALLVVVQLAERIDTLDQECQYRLEHRVLGREMFVQRALGDLGTSGDGLHAGPGQPLFGEFGNAGVEHGVALVEAAVQKDGLPTKYTK